MTPNTGTINAIHLVTTERGRYALRASAHNDLKRLSSEHELITWANKQHIPAIVPIPTQSGDTFVEYKAPHYTLFPFATGHQISRDNLQQAYGRSPQRTQ